MQIHEQIYTSASELLAPSQSDLGVVAESVGFPERVASQLSAIASYRILQDIPVDDPKMHPSRIVAMPRIGGSLYSVSRIVYAGADHSGRTTPLAHHVLIAVEDLVQGSVSLGDTIQALRNMFVDNWNQKPQTFDPPRSINVIAAERSIHSVGEANWEQLANVTGWLAGHFVDGLESNTIPVVFVLPKEKRDDSLKLLSAIYRALAPKKQSSLIFQSHVSSSSDLTGHAHIVATYPGSEYLKEIQSWPQKRRPTVVDLSVPLSSQFNNIGFANWMEKRLKENDSLLTMQEGLRLRESLRDIDETKYPDGFSQVWDFCESHPKNSMMASLDEIGQRSEALSAISPGVAEFMAEQTAAAVKDHYKRLQSDSDWQILLQILLNKSWPEKTRRLCLQAIDKVPERSFPIVLSNPDARQMPVLVKTLIDSVADPTLWSRLLQGEPQHAMRSREFLENQVASGALTLSVSQQATEILLKNGNIDQQQQTATRFLNSLRQPGPELVSHFKWLRSIAPDILPRLLDSRGISSPIADSLRNFLYPPEEPISHVQTDTFVLPTRQGATRRSATRSTGRKGQEFRDPLPWIRYSGIVTAIIAISGFFLFVWGKIFGKPQLCEIPSLLTLAALVISLLIAAAVFFCFSTNTIHREPNRQRLLVVFGFASVVLMLVASISVIVSFIVPFLRDGSS
jgi:hypothetical protein